jgi:hypothetical protein
MKADRRVLAVPVFGEAGGGTGEVGRLLWRVFQQAWPDRSSLITLQEQGTVPPSVGRKIRFGALLALDQVRSRVHSIVFGHLGLAGVECFVPGRMRAPYGVFLHGIEAWKPLNAVARYALEHASLRVANSHITARRLATANPGIGAVDVCPLALPPGTRRSGRSDLSARLGPSHGARRRSHGGRRGLQRTR